MAKEEYERNQEMWRLRHIDGWSNTKIGNKFGVSRERVRQIIGNTGKDFRKKWTEKLEQSGKYALELYRHDQIPQLPGIQKVWKNVWGKYRHDAKGGLIRKGQEFEELAYSILREHGIYGTLMPNREEYSILTENGAKIDVHSGSTNTSLFKSQKNSTPTWRVPNIHPENNFDFLMAFVPDGVGYTYFVIPRSALQGIKGTHAIRIPFPKQSADHYTSKWHQYHKRLDLIKEYPNAS